MTLTLILLLLGTLLFTLLMGLLFIFRPRPEQPDTPYDRLKAAYTDPDP